MIGSDAARLITRSFAVMKNRSLEIIVWVTMVSACADLKSPVISRLMQARQLASEMSLNVSRAAAATDRAVMADADGAAAASAQEVESKTRAVLDRGDQLAALLRGLDYDAELQLLQAFQAEFARYRSLDREILGLAVENTNVKAQRLSFGAGHQAADAMSGALERFARAAPEKERLRSEALSRLVVVAVREVEVLEAPHIAESDDAAMTALETRMSGLQDEATRSMQQLKSSAPDDSSDFAAAEAALGKFRELHVQIIALSRRNSNVRSLALMLGQKWTLTATCEARLQALSDSLAKRDFPATR